jgi:hypothetical protein
MNNTPFSKIKNDIVTLINKIKASDPAQGLYLEENIVIDDTNETVTYMGEEGVIEDILSKSVIK